MAQKDVGNKIPIYKLKKTDEVMRYYDDWGQENKYDKDMLDWNYTGPKETTETFIKYQKNKDAKIYDAGCGTGLVGVELKKFGYHNFYGADLSKKLLDFAKIKSDILFVGLGKTFQVWSPKNFEKFKSFARKKALQTRSTIKWDNN